MQQIFKTKCKVNFRKYRNRKKSAFDEVKWQKPVPPDPTHEVTKNGVHRNFAFEPKV